MNLLQDALLCLERVVIIIETRSKVTGITKCEEWELKQARRILERAG